jgi:hypothetical protein
MLSVHIARARSALVAGMYCTASPRRPSILMTTTRWTEGRVAVLPGATVLALVQAVRVAQPSSANVVSLNISGGGGEKAKVSTARGVTFSFGTREAKVSRVKPFSQQTSA